MMKRHIQITLLFAGLIVANPDAISQTQSNPGSGIALNNDPTIFPELVFSKIPGAPKLNKPILIMGDKGPVLSEGMGWATPAFYDWDGDGNKDLLIGEFGSGMENGNVVGNFIRVYENKVTDAIPRFANNFKYARGVEGSNNGTPITIYTWCCKAIRPQFFDLNDDGYEDIVAGQYNPGEVIWFKGGKKGFESGEKLLQPGNPASANDLPITDSTAFYYWNYSEVSFGDFDGDGDFDMIVGGAALRISENIGTRKNPKFGPRKVLFDTNGNPLRVMELSEELVRQGYSNKILAGNAQTVPVVFDWDLDGTLDLLVTNSFLNEGSPAITFFRVVKSSKGISFEPGVKIFEAKNGGKEFPGSWLRVYVTDWNNDGVNDLLVGTSIATLNDQFDSYLSWEWENKTGIEKKNPGIYEPWVRELIEQQIQKAMEYEKKVGKDEASKDKRRSTKESLIKHYFGKEEYRSLVHKGYVYVMLGKKEK